ncbi:MAG: MATE family efflux transporter, partial [Oscillospiraceae bacterium]|nr:MATE family efflux transporter [Oscillospiraceae bacterium]
MKIRNEKTSYIETLPLILSLAWPTMLEQMMQTAVQYIDIAMIGTLGTDATAAVGSTTTINWLINSSVSALSIGFLAFISQACGAKDNHRARSIVAQSVFVCIAVGLLFTAITVGLSPVVPKLMQVDTEIRALAGRYFMILYLPMLPRTASIIFGTALRAAGDTKTPMKLGVYVNLINVVLNYFLIYETRIIELAGNTIIMPGAGWGVEGAAAASAIAYTVGGLLITRSLWNHPIISPKGFSIMPQWKLLKPCLKVAVPNMFQRFGTSLGYVVFAAMINSLGEISTAAHTIANTVESA